jgi:chromosome segregation ATPase
MADPAPEVTPGQSNVFRYVAVAIAAIFMVFSLYSQYQLQNRISELDTRLKDTEGQLSKKIASTESQMENSSQALAQKMGMTQKELAQRTAELHRQQKAAEERLSTAQEEQAQKLGAVTGDLSGVKTDVGGVKTDVASTKTELEATRAKLERTIGDLGVQSGLIATTRGDLEVLKHRGDRNYFDFTLSKKQRMPVSTVSLELRKADAKKGKYTLNVSADDKTIEKKDKNMGEPVQFYTGRDHMLYELVVFEIAKDKVTGYLSTPKNAPQPVTAN